MQARDGLINIAAISRDEKGCLLGEKRRETTGVVCGVKQILNPTRLTFRNIELDINMFYLLQDTRKCRLGLINSFKTNLKFISVSF